MSFLHALMMGVFIQAAAPQQTASISGTVTEVGSGKAIPDAKLQFANEAGSAYSTTSGPNGEFLFTGLKPDSYSRLTVQALGHTEFQYSAHPELPELNLNVH